MDKLRMEELQNRRLREKQMSSTRQSRGLGRPRGVVVYLLMENADKVLHKDLVLSLRCLARFFAHYPVVIFHTNSTTAAELDWMRSAIPSHLQVDFEEVFLGFPASLADFPGGPQPEQICGPQSQSVIFCLWKVLLTEIPLGQMRSCARPRACWMVATSLCPRLSLPGKSWKFCSVLQLRAFAKVEPAAQLRMPLPSLATAVLAAATGTFRLSAASFLSGAFDSIASTSPCFA